jgi:hypothetical protein
LHSPLRKAIIRPMKDFPRLFGWSAVAFGALCVFVGASPLFPGIHWEGILIGLGSFGAGAWVLAGPELRATFRKAFKVMRDMQAARRRAGRRTAFGRAPAAAGIDPLLAVRILKLAKDNNGILSVADVAMGLNVPLDHAEAGLSECVRAGNAFPDYDVAHAHPVFRFPEFLPPEAKRIPG